MYISPLLELTRSIRRIFKTGNICTLEFFNLKEEKSANGIEFAQQEQLKGGKEHSSMSGNKKAQKDVGRLSLTL